MAGAVEEVLPTGKMGKGESSGGNMAYVMSSSSTLMISCGSTGLDEEGRGARRDEDGVGFEYLARMRSVASPSGIMSKLWGLWLGILERLSKESMGSQDNSPGDMDFAAGRRLLDCSTRRFFCNGSPLDDSPLCGTGTMVAYFGLLEEPSRGRLGVMPSLRRPENGFIAVTGDGVGITVALSLQVRTVLSGKP